MTIRAVTFHGPEDVRVESRPDPTPPTDGVVLRVDRAATLAGGSPVVKRLATGFYDVVGQLLG